MKKISLVAALLASSITIGQTKKALFLGNSYTYSNNLPYLINELAKSNGDTLIYDSNTPGGYTFQQHSTNATSLAKINAQEWDFVVLQEQSQIPSFSPGQVATDCYPYAALLDSAIKAAGCSETVFFMTWGRKYGDAMNCPFYPPVCTYEGMQDRLRSSYLEMMNEHYGITAPVGSAFWESRLQDSTINLYVSDNSHPSLFGSYLAACVFYATFWQESPVGLTYISTLPPADALFLQQVAEKVVLDSTDLWFYGYDHPTADFTYDCSFLAAIFTATTTTGEFFHWDFGDGTTSNLQNPNHIYSAGGYYDISLSVSDGCDTVTVIETIDIPCNIGVDELNKGEFGIYPNPASEQIYISIDGLKERLSYQIVDSKGSLVYSGTIREQAILDISSFPKGLYVIVSDGYSGRFVVE